MASFERMSSLIMLGVLEKMNSQSIIELKSEKFLKLCLTDGICKKASKIYDVMSETIKETFGLFIGG